MHDLAARVARRLEAGDVLLLFGPLGSGKTTFVQGLGRALGAAGRITSPTYTIISEHELAGNERLDTLVHIDLYRLPDGQAADDTAVAQTLYEGSLGRRAVAVEWAERLAGHLPKGARRITFAHGRSNNERLVTIA
jgi:tRNA threonylcarbamoyladenosine biosynthesis protein TsaE